MTKANETGAFEGPQFQKALSPAPENSGDMGGLTGKPAPKASETAGGGGKRAKPPMKAYAVTETEENTGGIVFARHAIVARRIGSQTFGDGDFEGWSCRRARWADHCAETGKVSAGLCIAHGWHFECHYCGQRIENDDDSMYRAWNWTFVVGNQHGAVYCDRSCELAAKKQLAYQKRLKARVLAHYAKRLNTRFAGITVLGFDQQYRGSHIYINHKGKVEEFAIRFEWPGQQYGTASFDWRKREGKAAVHCCSGDKEAFEAFAAANKRTAS